ncbi:MAG: DUF2817 domain-containing protein, partial [Promethearchaeia archaeon]
MPAQKTPDPAPIRLRHARASGRLCHSGAARDRLLLKRCTRAKKMVEEERRGNDEAQGVADLRQALLQSQEAACILCPAPSPWILKFDVCSFSPLSNDDARRVPGRGHDRVQHLVSAAGYVVWIYACDTARTAQHAPTHDVNAILSWNDDNCFWSSSYADARDKFVALGNALRDQLKQAGSLGQTHAMDVVEVKSAAYDVFVDSKCAEESYKKTRIYTDEMQPVAAGKDTVDVLLMTMRVHPAQAEKLNIICTSGVHGVEGYAGSAVQIWFLREILHEQQKILSQPGQQCDKSTWDTRQIMLIHAVNPFGMRNFRRFNENNCDL